MRILILGTSGLIGHKLFQILGKRFGDIHGVLHHDGSVEKAASLFDNENCYFNVDVLDTHKIKKILNEIKPDVILNCAGITKRRPEINDPLLAIGLNALFPHKLAQWAKEHNCRVIHFSTDCVFDGKIGDYTEDSLTTGEDAYGRTKALGEIQYDHTLTIRSSFIGRELSVFSELLEWLIAQEGKTIKGFTNAYYSGISTLEMSRVVGDIIEFHQGVSGLRQLSCIEPISKFELLCLARDAFGVNVEIVPDGNFTIKPTLNSDKLKSEINLSIPSWPQMMADLAADNEMYQ